MRCERHDPLNQCVREAVITVVVVTGPEPHEERADWQASACTEHAWEATARAALRVTRERSEGHADARVVAMVEKAGEQLLGLLQHGVTVGGERWPLAEPWVGPR
jgi:hypothetical protein